MDSSSANPAAVPITEKQRFSPFTPKADSKRLAKPHYFKRDEDKTDIEATPITNTTPTKNHQIHGDLDAVCQQSLKFAFCNAAVADSWDEKVPEAKIQSLRRVKEVIYSRYGDITEEQMIKDIGTMNPEEAKLIQDNLSNENFITPKFLSTLYLTSPMKRKIINDHIRAAVKKKAVENQTAENQAAENQTAENQAAENQTTENQAAGNQAAGNQTTKKKATEKQTAKKKALKDKENAGVSASNWEFRHLVDLCCIPLFEVPLDAIIPDYQDTQKVVIEEINKRYIVKRVLNEITKANITDLSLFSKSTHMSRFLQSPWLSFFISLRDLLTRGESEVDNAELSRNLESFYIDEDKLEASSEQLLHRFMEVVLLVFSIICNSRDEFRSTPSRSNLDLTLGANICTIIDDGYVYATRGGTSGHPEGEPKKDKVERARIVPLVPIDEASDRNRYGEVPIIRYETKRLKMASGKTSDVTAQIFSELLSAAVSNMKYLKKPKITTSNLDKAPKVMETEALSNNPKEVNALYHDAFVIHVQHYTLSIHTARFPTTYLKWVTSVDNTDICLDRHCILYKVSGAYNLSEPTIRLAAARDILVLLWAIKKDGAVNSKSKLFVARAAMKQVISSSASKNPPPGANRKSNNTKNSFLPDGTFPYHKSEMGDRNKGRSNEELQGNSRAQTKADEKMSKRYQELANIGSLDIVSQSNKPYLLQNIDKLFPSKEGGDKMEEENEGEMGAKREGEIDQEDDI